MEEALTSYKAMDRRGMNQTIEKTYGGVQADDWFEKAGGMIRREGDYNSLDAHR